MDLNYFVCTLGQAAELNYNRRIFKTINCFLDHQAEHVGDKPAVGFALPPSDGSQQWQSRLLSFREVQQYSMMIAELAESTLSRKQSTKQERIGLLCPSSAEFLLAWLALIRLGYAVLLLAPQCQPDTIIHLCRSCDVSVIFYHKSYSNLAAETARSSQSYGYALDCINLQTVLRSEIWKVSHKNTKVVKGWSLNFDQPIAYLHHTSGTSSGLPKPVPQSHYAAVGALPYFSDGSRKATFTTTPLFHGGIADLFRSWTSDALIWLFPGKDIPITALNVIKCLEVTADSSKLCYTPPVAYFSSVPYVLQMMEADENALEYLKAMELVGVGGAALLTEVGDRLVKKGVKLVSRFGSTECGFLMSSHRGYFVDQDWQYLRSDCAKHLRFESREDNLYELIVMPGWPHMAKANRPDGSYATADLFAPHMQLLNAWKYHSRTDSQLTLITGKKFDPAPLEAAIVALESIDDALVFGDGMLYPGVLLFRSAKYDRCPDNIIEGEAWDVIEEQNESSQNHARIYRSMIVAMPHREDPLEKNSKGTILRERAKERYATEIDRAYAAKGGNGTKVTDDEVPKFIMDVIYEVTGKDAELKEYTDLFAYGIDSIASMQIRQKLQELVPVPEKLALNLVEDCGTVQKVAECIINHRLGKSAVWNNEDQLQLMRDLVNKYSVFTDTQPKSLGQPIQPTMLKREVVILTGATGTLGVHILNAYRARKDVAKIYCLVRDDFLRRVTQTVAYQRVDKALNEKGFPGLDEHKGIGAEVVVLSMKLQEHNLGLDNDNYKQLAAEATIIAHVAWEVNFRMSLKSFEYDSLRGVQGLIELANSCPRRQPPILAFCSSIASVSNWKMSGPISEEISEDPLSADSLGYSQSKWIAENICLRAHESSGMKNRIAVLRVGQLSGDTKRGIWNAKEAWPMMLSTLKKTGSLPALENEPLNWLPVDVAAQAFVQITSKLEAAKEGLKVYHIVNQHGTPAWTDMLVWLKKVEDFDIVSPEKWLKQLEEFLEKNPKSVHGKLLALWQHAYGPPKYDGDRKRKKHARTFAVEKTLEVAPILRDAGPVDEEYFQKLWAWIKKTM